MSQRIVEQVTILCVQTRAYPSSQRQNCIFNTGLLIKEILVLYIVIFLILELNSSGWFITALLLYICDANTWRWMNVNE